MTMIKKAKFTLLFLVLPMLPVSAHYLWVETKGQGALGQNHEIRVYYGEYTHGVVEQVKGENFPLVAKFTLWLIAPDGTASELPVRAGEDHYLARFIPDRNGVYTVALNNNEVGVIDYTQYDFGIFKTHYHATAKVQVGATDGDTGGENPEGLLIKELESPGEEIRLQVLYQGEPLAENEVKVYLSDLWSKTLYTDQKGEIGMVLPWKTKYIVETTIKEETPGSYLGKDYQFIWHCATYCIR